MISVLLYGAVLYANPVTPEKALQVASRVFASGPSTKAADASSLQIVWDGEFEPATKAAQDPAFYVVSRPEGGFVMVAGNDNVQPVLAFSFENPFVVEGMPENVRAWMEQYKGYVRAAKTTTVEIQAQWSMFEETKSSTHEDPFGGPFTYEYTASHTNAWNQTNPANYYCPDIDDQAQTSVCGCVALATAEVMAWFGSNNLPVLTAYEIPAYSYQSDKEKHTVNIAAHGLTTDYSGSVWTDLKALSTTAGFYNQVYNYSTATTTEQAIGFLYYGANKPNPNTSSINTLTPLGYKLAHLTYDIGTLVKAMYNEGNNVAEHYGTGAATAYIVSKVAPVFGYNNAARYVNKENYTNSQWQQLLKDQITQHPVIYTGQGNGGHAYVADGYATYDGKLVFHFNMGWGGHNNGYYTLDIQDDFYESHSAILDFYPNPSSSTAAPAMGFGLYKVSEITYAGGIDDVSGYNTNQLTFTLYGLFNLGNAPFTGAVYAVRENASGERQAETEIFNQSELPVGSGWSGCGPFNVSTSSAVFGDQFVPYYKESGDGKAYLPFIYSQPLTTRLKAIPVFPAAAIKTKASYKVGDIFVFELTNHNYDYSTSAWTVTTPGGVTKNYTMASDAVLLSEAGDYKITCTTDQETITTYITVTTP